MTSPLQIGLNNGFHNFPDYPLSDVGHFGNPNRNRSNLNSDTLVDMLLWFSSQGASMRNPLRCVVKRDVERLRLDWGRTVTIYQEVLDCGHPYSLIPTLEEEMIAKRRRCAACGAIASLPPKKDVRRAVVEMAVRKESSHD